MCICMCVCEHVCSVHIYVHVCKYVHGCALLCVHACLCVCKYVCACICVCALMQYKLPSALEKNFAQPVWWPQGSLPVSCHSAPSIQFHPGTCGDTLFFSQPTLLHTSLLICLLFSRQPCFIVMCECLHMYVYASVYVCMFSCVCVCSACLYACMCVCVHGCARLCVHMWT